LTFAAEVEVPPAPEFAGGDPRLTRRALMMLGVLSAGSMIGVTFWLYLVNHYPLLLIGLSPLGRHLVLVAPVVDPVAFLLVAVVRRLLFYKASYDLGRGLGNAGIVWLENRVAYFARFVRWVEGLFERAPRFVVLVASGPTVSALAGISGMRQSTFVPLAILSLVARMSLMLGFAELLREQIEIVLAWIDEWWQPGTALMVVGMLVYQWIRIRRKRAAARVSEPE
jgi:membrane protein DedA with SNARE-associated domain